MATKQIRGLFLNCIKAQDSIYESGRMVFQCLQDSERYSLDYFEITGDTLEIPGGYDLYLFNYHIVTMSWLDTSTLRKLFSGITMTIVLEVSPNDPFVFCSPEDFDAYIVLDPTLDITQQTAFTFPRPLESFDALTAYEEKEVPWIGSFGFATAGKGFDHLIDAVNKEFDSAVVRINIPFASYTDESHDYAKYLGLMCKVRAKKGIEVIVTHDYMSKRQLVEWCGQNTINCFLYDRNMPGLAATTDQAISSGRPLLISQNDTFRHIIEFIKPYPRQSLKDAIENTGEVVKNIQREWSPARFREKFEAVLLSFRFDKIAVDTGKARPIKLPLKKIRDPLTLKNLRYNLALKKRIRNLVKGSGLSR